MTIVKNISVPLEKYIIAILQCQETLVCYEVTTVLLRLTDFGYAMRSNPIQDKDKFHYWKWLHFGS